MAPKVNWNMQNPYASTAYEKNYWETTGPEAEYMKNQLTSLGQEYGQKGGQVRAELADQGVGAGSIGQFAQRQRVDMPYSNALSNIYNTQYQTKAANEQSQFGRQAGYTTQLNDLSYQTAATNAKLAAEEEARNAEYENKDKNRGWDLLGKIGSGVASTALGPTGWLMGAAADSANKSKKDGGN